MANAIIIQNRQSNYNDLPGVAYHFPKIYLKRIQECVGDWVILYEGKSGALGYVSVVKVSSITPDERRDDHYFAWYEQGTQWDFEHIVPRNDPEGRAYEHMLRGTDGKAMSGGANTSAVRRLSFGEFSAIVNAGLEPRLVADSLPREGGEVTEMPRLGFSEGGQTPFESAVLAGQRMDVLSSRPERDQSFARQVKAAYKGRCAISGLDLRNGGGRAEVQAAHIRPVKDRGPDIVINGLALSGTVHWMFDRGLISIGENYEILVSDNKVPADVRQRLICPNGRLHLPENSRHHPHPEYLRYHRENIFGMTA